MKRRVTQTHFGAGTPHKNYPNKLTPSQHTHTHNMRLATEACLQQSVNFLWQQYCYERKLYMCIPINVYDMITTWYNFSFLFKLSVLLMKWMMYVCKQHYKLYIFTIYGIWNTAIIDHTYNSLVEKSWSTQKYYEKIRFINIFVTCFCAVDKSFYFTWLTIHIRITNSRLRLQFVDDCCVWFLGAWGAPTTMNSIWQRQHTNKQTDRQTNIQTMNTIYATSLSFVQNNCLHCFLYELFSMCSRC